MSTNIPTSFSVNGRTYSPPSRPIVVICIDGGSDEYLTTAIAEGRMPHTVRMIQQGYRGMCRGALPSYTNVNNVCIATGVPPSVTGVGGNFFLNPETGKEEMINTSTYLRCETILSAAAEAGRKVAMVTAKDKLVKLLCEDIDGIAFSSEKAGQAAETTHGIANVEQMVGQQTPEIYSAEASLFVLRAGVALIEQGKADFLYLSLTDFIQHKYDERTPEALEFYQGIDREIGRLLELDVNMGITADHGMNEKSIPNVLYLEALLTEQFGDGFKVICTMTDPYVFHHGALGSCVVVHVPSLSISGEVVQWISKLEGVAEAYDRMTAASQLELPEDRIGDIVVLSDRNIALGRTPQHHDLSLLEGSLRSHGGRHETMVPMLLSHPLRIDQSSLAMDELRNFDVFELTCNGALAREHSS